jgi:hypothetical protein
LATIARNPASSACLAASACVIRRGIGDGPEWQCRSTAPIRTQVTRYAVYDTLSAPRTAEATKIDRSRKSSLGADVSRYTATRK